VQASPKFTQLQKPFTHESSQHWELDVHWKLSG
jgi:hypothetical protein